ncbi:MAG: protein kinase [Myxococcales bacterium]|nr:protein kinase [Myxococcales bacterium]
MRGFSGKNGAFALVLALVLTSAWVLPSAAATGERQGVAVLAPRVDPVFESLSEGFWEWLSERFATAGIGVIVRENVQRALATTEVRTSRETPEVAAQLGAAMVLMSELRFSEGEADVRLRLHDGTDGQVITAATGSGRVAELGEVAHQVLVDLLTRLEFTSAAIEGAPPPRLSDWSALARARKQLDSGDPIAAWKEVDRVQLPAARRLKQEIEASGDGAGSGPALRSRLANATGQADRDWLRVRSALRRTDDPEMFLAAAENAAGRGQAASAARFYEQAVELAPDSAVAQIGRGDMLVEAGELDGAREAYEAAAELVPDDPYPHAQLGKLPMLSEAERAQHMMKAGDLHAARLEPEEARRAYEAATQADASQLSVAYKNSAQLHEKLGNHGEALLEYEQSVELGKPDPETLVGLGRTRARGEDMPGAESAYREALALNGKIAEAHRRLGQALVEDGRGDEGVDHLEESLELDPAQTEPRQVLSRFYKKRNEMDRALESIGIDGLPHDFDPSDRAELLRDAAEIHQEQGDFQQAEEMLTEAVEIEPDDPPIRSALASVYEAQGKGDLAREQQTLVAGLTGAEMIQTSSSPPAGGSAAPATGAAFSSFAALVESFSVTNPKTGRPFDRVVLLGVREKLDRETRIRRWLHPKRPDLEALEIALLGAIAERFPIADTPPVPANAESAVENVREFTTERETIATVNTVLESDATFVARVVTKRRPTDELWSPERNQLEVRLLGGDGTDRVFILANALALGSEAGAFSRWNYQVALPWAIILAILLYPVIRGWGRVVVVLDYDSKAAKGFFNIKLSKRPGKVGTDKVRAGGVSKNRRYQQKVRAWSRFAKNMAEGETVFRMVPARSWYVAVYGLLQDPKTQEVIGNYVEERRIKLQRGESTTLKFDFRPHEAPVEIRLVTSAGEGDDVADVQAVVALRGALDSTRYVRGGTAVLHVPNGQHTVLVGWEDRILEQQLLVQDFVGASLIFRIERDETALFTGCPDAVEPYLAGDLPAASQALDRAGHTELANLLRGEFHKARGEAAEAARYYQAAGHVQEAAELSAEADDTEHSATLFEHAGDFGKAGDQYRQSGDLDRAGAAYEAAYDYDAAIDCYRASGNVDKVMELLEKTGASFDAGVAALEAGDDERAIRNLQMVDIRDIQFHDACRQLAELFSARGDHGLAVAKLEDSVRSSGEDSAPLELMEQLGDTLERAGQIDRAIEVFEGIRKRDYAYPNAAERVSKLQELRGGEDDAIEFNFSSGSETVARPAPTQPSAAAESRYEIQEEIGRGGMGVVYKARDTRLGRIVALKRLPENLRQNPTAVELFLREARAAAALNHPNIVTLFDADEEAGNYYLTMEFLDGLPLDAILEKRGKLSPADTARLAIQICTGLHYAHESKVVHRDIKTSNLFFTRDRVVKIMDFGLAKMMEEVRRAATVIGGTPYYMAPEQATGEGVDHRADLYALGVTIFELATGTVPFREGDVTYHHRHTAPPDPRTLVPEIPAALAELILQLMSKDKNDRPASAGEVAERLAEI